MNRLRVTLVSLIVCPLLMQAVNKPGPTGKESKKEIGKLTLVKEVTVKSQGARRFLFPLRCDSDGNIYVLTGVEPSNGVMKLSPKGELLATFRATSATDLPIMADAYFSLGLRGDLYQIAFPSDTLQRAVLEFGKDGSYKSGIKLDTPPGSQEWVPYQVAAFSSGDLLVSGLISDTTKKISYPFTGVFSSAGQLRKEVALTDDANIQKMVEEDDPRVVGADKPYSDRAVSFGQMLPAEDGNIYLMRNLSPAIFYVISPAGEVVRRFTADVDGNILSAHISGERIALLYENAGADAHTVSLRVVDLEGKPIATYREYSQETHDRLGNALACYTDNPDRFTFLGTTSDGYLQFKIAEPQ